MMLPTIIAAVLLLRYMLIDAASMHEVSPRSFHNRPASGPSFYRKRTCGTIIKPTNIWQILQNRPNQSYSQGPFHNGNANFITNQSAGATDQADLVVSFKNMPCPPAGYGPYAIEFLYELTVLYSYFGQCRIDMFAVNANGTLPGLNGSHIEHPTWSNMEPLQGSLIGTFSLPTGADANFAKLINVNQLVCQREMNMRFSITNDDLAAGSVFYTMTNSTGLRIRYGC